MVGNYLRHMVIYLQRLEAAMRAEPTADKRVKLQKEFSMEVEEILVHRVGVSFWHCQDRTATECDLLYTEKLDTSKPATTSEKVGLVLLQYRRQIFQECMTRVPARREPASTLRYYLATLGDELGLCVAKIIMQDKDKYSSVATQGYEEQVRREFWEQCTPLKEVEYLTQHVSTTDKGLTSEEVYLWFKSHFPTISRDELMEEVDPDSPKERWRQPAIALLCDIEGVFDRPRFTG